MSNPTLKLSKLVTTINGFNPSDFTLDGTNTYIIGNGAERLLLDSGEGKKEWGDELDKFCQRETVKVTDLIITHRHKDHTGGIKQVKELFPDVRVWKRLPVESNSMVIEENGQEVDLNNEAAVVPSKYLDIEDGKVFQVQGATLIAIATPGHTTDHTSFHLKEENALFTGDCILGYGTSIFEDLSALMNSLNLMLNVAPNGGLYCGHGPYVKDGVSKIKEYISHRNKRDDDILKNLAKFTDPVTARTLVEKIYSPTFPPHILQKAEDNVVLHLAKLASDKKVKVVESSEGEEGKSLFKLI